MIDKPLRMVTEIERSKTDPHDATLTLACGHKKRICGFPLGSPPPCFRQICDVPGCCNA